MRRELRPRLTIAVLFGGWLLTGCSTSPKITPAPEPPASHAGPYEVTVSWTPHPKQLHITTFTVHVVTDTTPPKPVGGLGTVTVRLAMPSMVMPPNVVSCRE